MGIGRSASLALHHAGWEPADEIPSAAIEQLEAQSSTAIKLFSAVSEIYEIFHHAETDRWILVTDGGGSFKVNAPGLLIASSNPDRLGTSREDAKQETMIFTIGLDDKTVNNWLLWVGVQKNYPQRRPDLGFHYVS